MDIIYFLAYEGVALCQLTPEEYDKDSFVVSYDEKTKIVKLDITKKKEAPFNYQFELKNDKVVEVIELDGIDKKTIQKILLVSNERK